MNAANEHHARAMELADEADSLRLRGLETQSIQVYQRALTEAEEAVWLSNPKRGRRENALRLLPVRCLSSHGLL